MLGKLCNLMNKLGGHTVFAQLIDPLRAIVHDTGRRPLQFHKLPMLEFIGLGVQRHLLQDVSLRAQLQRVWALDSAADSPVVSRSSLSDALNSSERNPYTQQALTLLHRFACTTLPDRLGQWQSHVGERPIYAVDGTYQQQSAHYIETANDNAKGHCLLPVMDVRRALPVAIFATTQSQAEIRFLRALAEDKASVWNTPDALWLVDRAFIDTRYWDRLKRHCGATMVTQWKSNLAPLDIKNHEIDSTLEVNDGVVLDQRISLNNSSVRWRKIHYCSPCGKFLYFLSNDLKTEPGVLVALYARRWDEEKCFDQWKNDLSMGKAWGKSLAAIEQQAALAAITQILLALHLYSQFGDEGLADKKSKDRQNARNQGSTAEENPTERPSWVQATFMWVSKISRQVLRFFRNHLWNEATPQLYERQLRPMLERYF